MKRYGDNKLPQSQKKLPVFDDESGASDRNQFKEMNKNIGVLIAVVRSIQDGMAEMSKKVELNSELIAEIQSIVRNFATAQSSLGPNSSVVSVKSNCTPLSAMTDDGYADDMWRQTELSEKLSLRLTDPSLMEAIAEQTGADFLMWIRYFFTLFLFD